MRPLLPFLSATVLAVLTGSSFAQAPAPAADPNITDVACQHFEGKASQTTPPFQIEDSWEIRWEAHTTVNISVYAADGTLVAGARSAYGAIYIPKGGTYHLQIDYHEIRRPMNPPAAPGATPSPATDSPAPMRTYRPYLVEVVTMSAIAKSHSIYLGILASGDRVHMENYVFPSSASSSDTQAPPNAPASPAPQTSPPAGQTQPVGTDTSAPE